MFSKLRFGVFEVLLGLVLLLGALATVGIQDFGRHIEAQRVGIDHQNAPMETHATLHAAER